MYHRTFAVTLFVFIAFINAAAQTWSSELYPDNRSTQAQGNFYSDKIIQDFSYAGYHRGEQEVPLILKNVIDVTKPPYRADLTGEQDVTVIIQKAIDDAGMQGGGVVYFPKGTYKVSAQKGKNHCLLVSSSKVILRGAGTEATFIYNTTNEMRGKSIIKVDGGHSWNADGANKQRITKDLMSPTKVIPVESTDGFKVGDLVIIRNYINNNWIEEHGMSAYWKDKGKDLGGLLYCRQIVSISAKTNELGIDIPIRYALRVAHDAVVYKAPEMLTEVGVEDLSIGNRQNFTEGDWSEESYRNEPNGSYQCHDSWAIAMECVYNGWIRRIASYQPKENTSKAHILSNGIKVSQTKNVSILDCSFHNPQFGGGGGNGYMYRIMGNETLVKDCIAEFNRHGFVLSGMAASGNVFYHCKDQNSGRQTGLTGYNKTNGSGSDHHMHFSHSNLFDQCTVENSFFAAGWRKWGGSTIHGLTGAHSVYWNLASNGSQQYAVETQQGRYGYVIGTSGNQPSVNTSVWQAGTESITDPVDHVEGIGKGATLMPQSLYMDQVKSRLTAQKGKASFSVIPLGVKGGLDESNLSAYLVGAAGSSDYVCVDAGTVYSGAEKAIKNGVLKGTVSSVVKNNIKGYLISHPHLDHVSGLIINSPEDTVKNIYALPFTIKTLQEKYFSWQSWANFADAGEIPQLKKYHYVTLPEGQETLLQNTALSVTAFPLSHSTPGQSTAYLIKNGTNYLLYLGDTGPDAVEQSDRLQQLWQTVAPLVKSKQLKAIFIEVSFFNDKADNQLFGHLTPKWLMTEMSVLNQLTGDGALNGFPVVVTHSKSFGKEEMKLQAQIQKENKLQLKLIFPQQGLLYQF